MDERLVIIGMGYVGEALADLAFQRGIATEGVEISAERIRQLAVKPYRATQDAVVVSGARWVVLAVPTPVDDAHMPNLAALKSACTMIGPHLRPETTVIVESTVAPGTCEKIVARLLQYWIDQPRIAHCPERVDPGRDVSLAAVPRVLAANSADALDDAATLYSRLLDVPPHIVSDLKTAEMTKIVENSFRDINIAFVNEMAVISQHLDIDVAEVLDAAATKPYGFMRHDPGCGVGGHCIPVDPYYLVEAAEKSGVVPRFLKLSREINESMPAFTVDLLDEASASPDVRQGPVAVLGVAYKPNVADTRESPSFAVVAELRKRGFDVRVFDPHRLDLSDVKTLDEALDGARSIVLCTAHRQFLGMEDSFADAGIRVVIDGRNALNRERLRARGVLYRGIGRPETAAVRGLAHVS
ncbi:MAG: nucleotide sugar dehydrogenase [Dehalococcoidia bacterium]